MGGGGQCDILLALIKSIFDDLGIRIQRPVPRYKSSKLQELPAFMDNKFSRIFLLHLNPTVIINLAGFKPRSIFFPDPNLYSSAIG